MIPDTAQLLAAPPWLLDLIDVSTRVTVLLVAAALTVFLMRRAPAHARHQVWAFAMAGALLLPLMALVLPAWHLRILPAARAPRFVAPPQVIAVTPVAFTAPMVVTPLERLDAPAVTIISTAPHVRPPLLARVASDVMPPAVKPVLPMSLGTWLLCLWLAGIVVVLGRLALDRLRVWYLNHDSRPVRDERSALFARQLERLGLTRVALVELDEVELPMTWGVLRPTVALPAASRRWSTRRLEAVMLHELAHVRRRDALSQLIASLTCALYWFHPLTWLAARQMRVLREYACDDEVLGQGVRPSSYAEEIIGIVKALSREERDSSATLAMARRSELGDRLLALLNPHIPHARLRRGPATMLSVGALGVLVSIAVVRPAAAEPPPTTLPRLTPSESAKRKATTPAPAAQAAPEAAPNPQAQPVPDARPATPGAPAVAPMAPLPPAAPMAPEAPAAPERPESRRGSVSRSTTWSSDDDDTDEPDEADDEATVMRDTRRDDDDELRRIEAMRRDASDEWALAKSLLKLARDADFKTETSRQAFLAAAASLQSDGLRGEVLVALLKGAPTSVETGRGVLAQAQRLRDDGARAEVLSMMHHLRESDLVRGPLANAYLDVAGQLQAPDALAHSLQQLLHPRELPTAAVERSLELLKRVSDPRLRQAVLIEVTDHQVLTDAVERAYTGLTEGFDAHALRDAQERLAEAKTGRHRSKKGWAFWWSNRGDTDTRDADRRQADADRRQADADRRQADADSRRAELDRARQTLERERDVLRRHHEELRESARRLRDQAREFGKQYQQRAKELEKELKRRFGKDADVNLDPGDFDVDVDLNGQ